MYKQRTGQLVILVISALHQIRIEFIKLHILWSLQGLPLP